MARKAGLTSSKLTNSFRLVSKRNSFVRRSRSVYVLPFRESVSLFALPYKQREKGGY